MNGTEKYTVWAIVRFPEEIKNRFLGWAKTNGKTAAEALEYVVAKFLRETKEGEGK